MPYEIILKPAAEKAFAKLTKSEQLRIITALEALALHPRPSGVKKLKSLFNLYRIRVGDYRIIYEINDSVLIITVVKIWHRREVYK